MTFFPLVIVIVCFGLAMTSNLLSLLVVMNICLAFSESAVLLSLVCVGYNYRSVMLL